MSSSKYIEAVEKLVGEIKETQIDKINQAAQIFADTIRNDKIIYHFGTGHSHMIGIEMFVRAGGLANVQAMLDSDVLTSSGARRGGEVERLSGLAKIIWDDYEIEKATLW